MVLQVCLDFNRAGMIRSAAETIYIQYRLADTIHIGYNTHVHDLRFQNQEF